MIGGHVISDEARIRLNVRGSQGQTQEIVAVIDTGYSGELTLPPKIIANLGLDWRSSERATLADGSECQFEAYNGAIIWDGKLRSIIVDEADAVPLVGMKLLKGFELKLQVRNRGKVTIRRLKSK